MINKANFVKISWVCTLVVAGVIALRYESSQTELKDGQRDSTAQESSVSELAIKAEPPANEIKGRSPDTPSGPAPTNSVKSRNRRLVQHPAEKKLSEYAELKSKVFLTEEEKKAHAQLLSDHAFVASLKDIVLTPADIYTDDGTMQNNAIDLLLEARQSGSEAASAVLRDVISDRQIEDDSLALEDRKSLAGIKGEILFEWSAREPKLRNQISSWLPGPVSRKIWENITILQEQNLELSAQMRNSN